MPMLAFGRHYGHPENALDGKYLVILVVLLFGIYAFARGFFGHMLYLLVRRFLRDGLVFQLRGFRVFKLLWHDPSPCFTMNLPRVLIRSLLLRRAIRLRLPSPIPRVEHSAVPVRLRPLNCFLRDFVLRFAFFALLFALIYCPALVSAQNSPPPSGSGVPSQAGTSAENPSTPSAEVAAAESAIAGSDWKTAESKLDAYLATHPTDASALFDAGYVADAQNRLDAAAALSRRAIAANPKAFAAHISLGLLLARQNKFDEARPELVTAATLDPGEPGPALKARAWRALARIDRSTDPAAASNDLLEALKLSPETPEDTLLAAELAEQAGQNDAAEAAYRRVLLKDPRSVPANALLVSGARGLADRSCHSSRVRPRLKALGSNEGLEAMTSTSPL